VNEVVFRIRVEPTSTGEVVQVSVDVLEVPRIRGRIDYEPDLGFRRDVADVIANDFSERSEMRRVQQLEPIDEQIFVLTGSNARTPALPPFGTLPTVDCRPKQADDDHAPRHISQYKYYP